MAEETPPTTPSSLWATGWKLLSGCFRIALMPGKIILAGMGVLCMATGWWLLALIFGSFWGTSPEWPGQYLPAAVKVVEARADKEAAASAEKEAKTIKEDAKTTEAKSEEATRRAWQRFKDEQSAWNLMYETAGLGKGGQFYSVEDVARTPAEMDSFKTAGLMSVAISKPQGDKPSAEPDLASQGKVLVLAFEKALADGKLVITPERADQVRAMLGKPKPVGKLNTWPWSENRGANPLMLVSGSSDSWNNNKFLDWLLKDQGPVLIEPVLKMLRPVAYLFHPKASTWLKIYFLLVALWTIVVWSVFGGAIARMAGMELARDESISMREGLQFSMKRLGSLVLAPLTPLFLILILLVLMSLFGMVFMIPVIGDILLGGLGWFLPLLVGFGMAIVLVGLLAWPLMIATVAVDSEDFIQATSRGVSYLYQRPRGIALFALKALLFGAASIFVVGFMSSLAVYMAKWSVSQTPFITMAGRDPDFLFVHAPTTFGWRDLLLDGTTVNGSPIVVDGKVDATQLQKYKDGLNWWNHAGAFMASGWLYLALLLALGFGYSFFWSACTSLYLALRLDIESFDLNEIYLDEPDEEPESVPPPPTPVSTPAPVAKANANGGVSLSMVDAPASPATGGGSPNTGEPGK